MNAAEVWEVAAFRAECRQCGWKGPYRATQFDARPDRDRHQCPPEVTP